MRAIERKERRKVVGFLADKELWRRFKTLASNRGLTIGEILVSFIEGCLKDEPEAILVGKRGHKSRASLEVLSRSYVPHGKDGAGKGREPEVADDREEALDKDDDDAPSQKRGRFEEGREVGNEATGRKTRDFTPSEEDCDDEGMTVTDMDLVEHASHFSIKVCGDEGALREKVLRAIEEEHGERGGDEEWIGANLGMLRWYNDNRG